MAELELPIEERETLDSGLRQIDFLDGEVTSVDRVLAHDALNWPEARRLMTVPGVNLIAAATFLAAVGNIERFPDRRKLVGYLGLDPKVRQPGDAPATHGHIAKQGSAAVRVALVEASWSAVRQPGPLRAFYRRVRARRGHQIAITATARKLACLFWVLLWCQQDYAFGQHSSRLKAAQPQEAVNYSWGLASRSGRARQPLRSRPKQGSLPGTALHMAEGVKIRHSLIAWSHTTPPRNVS